MKRYRFRLEQVLRVRRLQEERERAQVLAAQAELAVSRDRVQEAIDAYRVMAHARGRTDAAGLRRQQELHHLRAKAVEAARRSEATSLELLEARIAGWRDADTRVRVLEHLDARRREEHQLEANREADKDVDDLVVSRHRVRRPEAPADRGGER